jgi:cell division protein FtsB
MPTQRSPGPAVGPAAGRDSARSRRLRESRVKKKLLGLAAFLIVALSVLNAFFGERGVLGLMKARDEYRTLAKEVEALHIENQRLASEIHALRTDPLVIERRAREVLGMARPGEIALEIRTPEQD